MADLGIAGLGDGELIGSGGNAYVYKAHDVTHDRWVAVKVLRGADDDTRRRFDRERRAMGRLTDHDGIVTVFHSGFTDRDDPYLVMSLCEGGSLQDDLDRNGPFAWDRACALMADVAETVHYAHLRSIVHRDLKPGNILYSVTGRPLVSDFGISRFTEGSASMGSVALTFTPSYCPPEVIDGAEPSVSADVYALGATLYALLAGHPPFATDEAESIFSVMRRIANEPVPDLRTRGVPGPVCDVYIAAMEKAVGSRPVSASQLADMLRAVPGEVERSAPPASPAPCNATIVVPPPASQPLPPTAAPQPPPPATPAPPPASAAQAPTAAPPQPPPPTAPAQLPSAAFDPPPPAPGGSAPVAATQHTVDTPAASSVGRSSRTALLVAVGALVVAIAGGVFAFASLSSDSGGDDADSAITTRTGSDTDDAAGSDGAADDGADDAAGSDAADDGGADAAGDGDNAPGASDGDDDGAADDGSELDDDGGATVGSDGLPVGAGGTLVWVHDREPPSLHFDDPDNNLVITSWLRQPLMEGLYGIDSANNYYPQLLAGPATVVDAGGGGVVIEYQLRDGLVWSDGEPLTSADVEFTHRVMSDPDYLLADPTGYELITGFEVLSDVDFRITLSAFVPGYQRLFDDVFPAHALAPSGAEANAGLADWTGVDGSPLPSSGPMVLESWTRGSELVMQRNAEYHGSVAPDADNEGLAYVDGVRIVFVPDLADTQDALISGASHIHMSSTAFSDPLPATAGITAASPRGWSFEHWGLNLLNPHLADPVVREALAFAIDKSAVVSAVFGADYGASLPPNGLGNVFWLSDQAAHVDHQGIAGYGRGDSDAARELLEAGGYVGGADGVYEHPQRGRLTLRVGTTGGNVQRERIQAILIASAGKAGFEMVVDNPQGADYFLEQPFAEAAIQASASQGAEGDATLWDVAQFAWVSSPSGEGQGPSYLCGDGGNPYGYCNPEFDARSETCSATADDAERASCFNDLNRYVSTLELDPQGGLFVLPISQRPTFFAYRSADLDGFARTGDATFTGPLANVVDYRFAQG